MDERITRYLQGRATDADQRQLQRWREASPRNEERFRELEQVWGLLGTAEPAEAVHDRPVWDAGRQRVGRTSSRDGKLGRRRGGLALGAAAAAIALIVLGRQAVDRGPGPAHHPASTEFVTSKDENATIRLGDGSVVRLGPESRVRVSTTESERGVWLEGQAFFAVTRDPQRPFVVRTDAGEARVLGTRFDVRVRNRAMTVLVVEGTVAVSNEGEEVEVGPRQMSYQETGSGPSVVTVEEPERMLDWMGQFMVFQATPLREAASEIEAKYGYRVEFADPLIAQRTVTAWFTDQEVQEVLMTICRVANASCSIGVDVTTMTAN